MSSSPVDLFLAPKRVALIGVSKRQSSITARPAQYLQRFGSPAEVAIVRADGPDRLYGHEVVSSIRNLEPAPDVAMVMVPAESVPEVLGECALHGVKGAVVISSGFEGGHGVARRRELEDVLACHPGFRLMGPNCVGVLSPATDCWLTFSSVLQDQRPFRGRVGLVTQSGAVGNGLLLALQERGVGVAHWFSTGDEVDVGSLEVAAGLLRRDDCQAVGLFLEGITDFEHRAELAQAIAETEKRVVAVRAAASEQGKRAAMGHTGRVVGRDEIARAALEEIGVVLVDELEQLTDVLTLLSVVSPAPNHPVRTAVVTVSGATGVMAADEIAQHPNLSFASFGEQSRQAIADVTGTVTPDSVENPLDVPVLGDPSVFERAINAVAGLSEVDATIAIVSTLAHDYERLSMHLQPGGGPLGIAHLSPVERFTAEQSHRLTDRGVAPLQSPRNAVRALSIWATQAANSEEVNAPDRSRSGVHLGLTGSMSRFGSRLDRWFVRTQVLQSEDEAIAFLEQHDGGGIVLKADGKTIQHRADVGAVETNLLNDHEVKAAFERIELVCGQWDERIVGQPMARSGIEVMVSVLRDPEVGLAALLRPGGGLVEIAETDSVVLTQARRYWSDAIRESTLGALLTGWRGAAAHDIDAMISLTSDLMDVVGQDLGVQMVECNPVLVHESAAGGGATIVDMVTYLEPEKE